MGIVFLDEGKTSESQVSMNVKYNFFLYPTTGQGRSHSQSLILFNFTYRCKLFACLGDNISKSITDGIYCLQY
jgi:hypothetical protein